jgi:hypothetical protein
VECSRQIRKLVDLECECQPLASPTRGPEDADECSLDRVDRWLVIVAMMRSEMVMVLMEITPGQAKR